MDSVINIFHSPFSIGFLVIFVANAVVAGIVYSQKKWHERAVFWFSFLVLVSVGWSLAQLGTSIATTAGPYAFWYAMTELMVSLIMPMYLCFVLAFVGKEKILERFEVVGFLGCSIAILLFLYWKTDIITIHNFSLAVKTPWGYEYPRGVFPFDIVIIMVYFIYAFIELFSYYARIKDPIRKHQIGVVTFALMIPSIGGILFQGILPVVLKIPELPATPPLILVTCCMVTYALLKYGVTIFSFSEVSGDLLQMIPDSFLVLDSSFHIQMVNPSAAKLLGGGAEELVGRTMESFLSAQADKNMWREKIFDPLIHGHEVTNVEMKFPGEAGSTFPVRIHAVVRYEENSIVNIILLITDISIISEKEQEVLRTIQKTQEQNVLLEENKKAMLNLLEDSRQLETELKTERDRATAIVTSMSEGLFVVDQNNRIILINPIAERLLEISDEKVTNQNFVSIVTVLKAGTVLSDAERPLMRTLTTGESIFIGLEDDYQLKTTNGKVFPASMSTAALKQGDKIVGALMTFHDITKDKEVRQTIEKTVDERTHELKREQARLTASISSLSLGFIMTNTEGKVVLVNDGVGKVLGLKQPLEYFDDLVKVFGSIFDIRSLKDECEKEKTPVHVDSISFGTKWIRLFMAPVITQDSAAESIGVVFLIEDITEAKVLERSREEFFSIASHELRTPLTAIRGNTSMMLEYYGDKLSPDLKEMVDDTHESSIRLIDIVNDFLDMSRLEQGRMNFQKETFDVAVLITDVLKEYEVTGSRQKLYLKYEPPEKPMPLVFADKNKVKQILINLVGNALKFTEEGGVTVRIHLYDGFVRVVVEDTGRGIPLENQMLLFHKFQQASNNLFTRDTTRGTGLGLYISKLIIEQMGGNIGLEYSQPGKGSAFGFALPIAKPKA